MSGQELPPYDIVPQKRKRNPLVLVGERAEGPVVRLGFVPSLVPSWLAHLPRSLLADHSPGAVLLPKTRESGFAQAPPPPLPDARGQCLISNLRSLSWHPGAVATGGVLLGGLVAFKNGKSALAQQFMRARVLAQGITVAIMVSSGG